MPKSVRQYGGGGSGGGGVTNHGTLTGLSDDDHSQYHNDTRGDARYYTQSQVDSSQGIQDTAIGLNTTHSGSVHAPTDADNTASNETSHVSVNAHMINYGNPHGVVIDDVTPTSTKGDVIVENGSNAVRLGVGTDDQVLTAASGEVSGVKWATSSSGFSDPMTTRGDMIVRNASNATDRLGVGTVGQVVTSDGTDIGWDDASGGSTGGLYGINVETLAADKTLTVGTDKMYQYLNDGGSNRIITLDTASASAGDRWIIKSTSSYNGSNYIAIYQATTNLDYMYGGTVKIAEYIFDGTNWKATNGASGEDVNTKWNMSIGFNAKAYSFGTAIGYASQGYSNGVAIGYSTTAYQHGIGIGHSTHGRNYGVAIGYACNTNSNYYSAAIGEYSEAERYGEMARNIDAETDQENSISYGGWSIETTSATATEMLAGGYSAQRYTIRASSSLAFTIHVTARDNTSGDCAGYKFEGVIKRDGSSNTALVGTVIKTILAEEDTSWDCEVTADDTNESLKIEVTGDATNTVQWAATSVGVETHF